ncbi:IPT/TIG domain-containing protein [Paenibacillus sp. CAA11]|uniref:IPT/TIG domain-containing protein n=1 Tax=Paenibacillus sp. CAA11 TaxID=1532905 RepID=UPI001F28081C|nr:IPT/TIG domain-containing protein [Paenibacillus sp. CAA11]
MGSTARAASEAVQVTKVVNPSAIVEGGEANVQLNVQGSPDVSIVKPNDIILIIDRSGSMAASYAPNKGEDKMKNAKNAAKGFIDLVDFSKHRVGIVDFASDVKYKALSDNPAEVKNYVDTIQAGGGTGTKAAIAKAQELLKNHRPDAQPVILLMTDGQATEPGPESYARQVALDQANSAKAEDVVFYTIALLLPSENPETSAPNLLMKAMATTAQHHHFVLGSVGLAQIYAAIVDEIGLSSAYNAVVTDTVSPEFEIVPDSYKDNIPQPTVVGNTLTWKFNELKRDTLTFNYKIRHKTGAKIGDLPVGAQDIKVKYDDYLGALHEFTVPNPKINVKYAAPTITSIVKDNGLINGGESVTITGEHFRPNVKVQFGTKPATSVQFVDSTKIIVITPAGTQGNVDVKVTNDDNQSATGKYTYYAIPEITKITPVEGPLAGNNEVSIEGNYFMTGATVKFGDKAASVVSTTPTKIIVKAPAAVNPGLVAVSITNPDGYSTELPNAYSYVLGPELNIVEPNKGTTKGGELVTLTGSRFKSGAKVFFNDKEVAATYVSGTTLTVSSPSWNKAESVTVKVVNPDGQFAEKTQGYTYSWPQPMLTSILPNEGETTGGTLVTITGRDFQSGVKVYFNDQLVPNATFYSSTQIKLQTPVWNTAEAVTVKVVNPDGQAATLEKGFNYLLPPPPPAPVITTVAPDHGLVTGGTSVVITGSNFVSGVKVKLKDQELATTFVSSTQLKITTPAWNSAEVVNVSVTNPDGQTAIKEKGYTFETPPAPVITSISPNEGKLNGGLVITLSGSNFDTGAKVYFNDSVIQATVYGSGQIKVVTPKWTNSGPVDVKVTNGDGQSVTLANGFNYLKEPAPTLSSLSPSKGMITGGTEVTVQGTNFVNGAKLTFGNQQVATTFVSATQLKFKTPVWSVAEQVDIQVTNPDGQTASLAQAFTFETPPPPPPMELTSVSPNEGEMAGGLLITVTGNNFDSGAKVYFNDTLIQSTVYGATQIKAKTPVWTTSGPVNVKVVNGDGQTAVLSNAFTYLAPPPPPPPPAPVITTVAPDHGLVTGGTSVVITGSNFVSGVKVKLKDQELATTFVSSTQLKITTPAWNSAEVVNVSVTNPDGQTAIKEKGYTFETPPAPVITSISPNEGKLNGGLVITLSGSNFDTGAKVYFNDSVIQATVYGSGQIKVVTPKWTNSGPVDVKVTNGDGQSVTLANGFNYLKEPAPTLSSLSPSKGMITGGTEVTVQGTNFVNGAKLTFGNQQVATTFVSATQLKFKTPVWSVAEQVDIQVTNPDGQTASLAQAFTFETPPPPPPVELTSVSPNEGEMAGGLLITVTGNNFDSGAKVYFNDTLIQSTVYGATQIKAKTPVWTTSGPVNVKVVNGDGQTAVLSNAFTYLAPPPPPPIELTSVTPNEGEMAGGLLITISGKNFDNSAKVYFNDTLIQSTVYGATQIKAKTPAWKTSESVNIKVVNGDGRIATLEDGFKYLAPPPPPPLSIATVSPSEGEMAGGLIITLTGENFETGSKVYFNDTLLQSTTYSTTQIKVRTPKWASYGPVTIRVVNPDGSSIEKADGFTYKVPPVPTITSVTPNQGELTGGLVITIIGTDFDSGAKVYFNDTLLSSTTYSSTQIKASTPKWNVIGPVDIKIVNSTGQSTIIPAGYNYLAPPKAPAPIITSVTPAEGPIKGGTLITLTGQNFDNAAKVYFNDTLIQSTTYSKTSIKALTPVWPSVGPVTIKVVNADGQTTELVNGYMYK